MLVFFFSFFKKNVNNDGKMPIILMSVILAAVKCHSKAWARMPLILNIQGGIL